MSAPTPSTSSSDATSSPRLPSACGWRVLYRVLLMLAVPLAWLRLAWRSRRIPALSEGWAERRGSLPFVMPPGGLWLHTVSVGETIAAAPLVRAVRAAHPDVPLLVTTMTHTGRERARTLFATAPAATRHIAYVPYDTPGAVARVLDTVRPRALLLLETELWPNLLEACARRQVPVLLLNARLSERSARGYARLGDFARRMFGQLTFVACQSQEQAARFVSLGVRAERIEVTGNLKFDLALDAGLPAAIGSLRARLGERPVWIAASTHEGEEVVALAAHRQIRVRYPNALLILVPRHPERAAGVRRLAGDFVIASRSEDARMDSTALKAADVLLGDRMGELLLLYGVSRVAFVGGSLVDAGGHNPIEPALLGVPVLLGPSDRNFVDLLAPFRAANAFEAVLDAASIAAAVCRLLEAPDLARERSATARAVALREAGATRRLLAIVERYGLAAEAASPATGTAASTTTVDAG